MDELEQWRSRALEAEQLANDLQARLDTIGELAHEAIESFDPNRIAPV
jgi:hypothetical protein